MPPHGFGRRKAHDGKGQNDQGGAGQGSAQASPSQVADAQQKSGHKRFPAADFAGLHQLGPGLKLSHFLLKAEKYNQRHNHRKPHNKKCQDDDHRAIGQSKCRMHIVNNNNQQDQN